MEHQSVHVPIRLIGDSTRPQI